MKKFLIAVCFLATVFDAFATALGLCVAAKVKTFPGYLFSAVGALTIIALMVSARDTWRKADIVYRCMRIFWCMAFIVNMGAVFLATGNHMILERPLSDSVNYDAHVVFTSGILQIATIAVLTVFLTAAPVGVSFLWKTYHEDDEEDIEEPVRVRQTPPKVPA